MRRSAKAWIQRRRSDSQWIVWTTASHPDSGARIMASSVPTHGVDTVTIRNWFGHYVDWVATTPD